MSSSGQKISALFVDGPPPTPEEVRRIVASCPENEAREALIQLVRENVLFQHHFGLFVELAKMLDIAVSHTSQLFNIAKNKEFPQMVRQFAVVALTTSQSTDVVVQLFGQLDPALVVAASDMPFIDMMTAIQMDPSIASDLPRILMDASPEEQEFMLLNHISRVRREVGTPASLAYREALADPALAHIHHHMIESVVQERDSNAAELLTSLRDSAPNDEARKQFQLALLRMGTKQIEDRPGRNEPDARSYVSICDGQGAFFLICRFKMSEAHSSTATCCIRASQEIRDAFVFPQYEDSEFFELLGEMENEQLAYTEVPLGQAATIFGEALQRTRQMGKKLPDSAAPVISLFERISPLPLVELKTIPESLNRKTIKDLLSKSQYASWFFDCGDLKGSGIVPPAHGPYESWYDRTADVLSRTPLKMRLTAMLEHMFRWHSWNDDEISAGVCLGALRSVEQDFRTSLIVRIMLERSLVGEVETLETIMYSTPEESDEIFGNEKLRTMLRRRFYPDLKRPSGKHIAELDFTEVAYRHLHRAFSHLPGEKRPREDDVLEIAYEVAQTAVQSMLKKLDAESMIKRIERRVIKRIDLTERECTEVVASVVEGMVAFVGSACHRCSRQCLASPRKGMADTFFSPRHPSTL